MYYRINKEPNGCYMTADEKRVALLQNPKPAPRYRSLYTLCATEEEAIRHFGLTYAPLPETPPCVEQ